MTSVYRLFGDYNKFWDDFYFIKERLFIAIVLLYLLQVTKEKLFVLINSAAFIILALAVPFQWSMTELWSERFVLLLILLFGIYKWIKRY